MKIKNIFLNGIFILLFVILSLPILNSQFNSVYPNYNSVSYSNVQSYRPGYGYNSNNGIYGNPSYNYDSQYGDSYYSGYGNYGSGIDLSYSSYGYSNSYNLRNQYYSSYSGSYPSSSYGSYPQTSYGYGRYYQPFPSQEFLRGQNPSINLYGSFNESQCGNGQDFIVQVVPFGCSPSVVRSDLLESQNVPVFCQLAATKLNPLIDIDAIYSMEFSRREKNENVIGVGFHPARAALRQSVIATGSYGGFSSRSGTLLNSPILNNVGYAVIVLKQQPNEQAMQETVSGNLTAILRYDLKNAFGIGAVEFALPEVDQEIWDENYRTYSFWNGKGFLRAESVDVDRAVISLMSDQYHRTDSIALTVGEQAKEVRLPGFYCLAKADIKLERVTIPDTTARMRIDDDEFDLVSGQRFLDDRCRVNVVEKNGLFEFVQIQCQTDDFGTRYFDFRKSPAVILNIGGVSNSYRVGDLLPLNDGINKYYLAGVDTNPQNGKLSAMFDSSSTYSQYRGYQSTYTGYNSFLYGGNNQRADMGDVNGITIGASTKIIFEGLSEGTNEDFSQFSSDTEINALNSEFKKNFENSMNDYNRLAGDYAFEKISDSFSEETYGEIALREASSLASRTGQVLRSKELLYDLRDRFKESGDIDLYINESDFYSEQESRALIINGRNHVLTFLGSRKPTLDQFSAEISVRDASSQDTETYTLGKDNYVEIGTTNGNSDKIILRYVDDISVDIDYIGGRYNQVGTSTPISTRITIPRGLSQTVGDYTIFVGKTTIKKVAYVRITPKLENVRSEANFTYNIGVEKRAIELSPQKTQERMESVNNTLEKLNKISDGLGKVVKANKAACLVTGGVLITKNLLSNLGGKQIARQAVMRSEGGWTEYCKTQIAEGTGEYSSIDDCFNNNAPEIDRETELLSKYMEEQNEEIKNSKETTGASVLGTEYYNHDKYLENYLPQVRKDLENCGSEIVDPTSDNRRFDTSKIKDSLTPDFEEKGGFYVEQARDMQIYCRLLNSGEIENTKLEDIAKRKLYSTAKNIDETTSDLISAESLKGQFTNNGFEEINVHSYGSRKSVRGIYSGEKVNGDKIKGAEGLDSSKEYAFEPITYNNEDYILILEQRTGSDYRISQAYKLNGVNQGIIDVSKLDDKSGVSTSELMQHFNGFTKYDENSYNNPYKKPEAKFYESEPYKGFPAVVPFDINRGWYAATKQTVAAFGNLASYDDSGRVSSFWICNVGSNGLEEFDTGYGDDHCQQINIGTGQPYGEVLGLPSGEAGRLVGRAIRAIESASNQRNNNPNLKSINIEGRTLSVGEPAVNIPQVQCQDFMSPKDCQVMFNVCDPVICPSSRCDLGGNYHVPNVIQSGIAGSIALCLPNYKEGILVPICLSGVNAGVQGLESVYQNYYDCLQESLETGRQTGICDEIHSIYLCDFFWRQAAPIAKIGLPKIVGSLLGEGSRGGGEYLGVKSAWDNAESSVDYFTASYAQNSVNAFRMRSTDEVGTAVCKSFVSVRFPDMIENLIEPDSPVQYHAWFDEIPFTSATVPATSQYKVFYHIFAGKDVGSYFTVYLKSAPGISFYETPERFVVASGFIERGGYKSDTIEFTQTTGFKELCVSVNAQEECGFAKVSTSFALDYLQNKYLEEQSSTTGIMSESECVSGSPSVYSLANPNLQEGLNDAINPQLYNYGIVRVCSTENPGNYNDAAAGTEASRWRAVGNCDGNNGKVKCWVDTRSVKENIDIKYLEENALDKITDNYAEVLEGEEGSLDRIETMKLIEDIKSGTLTNKQEINAINANLSSVVYSDQKAELILLRARAYGEIAFEDYSDIRNTLETRSPAQEIKVETRNDLSIQTTNVLCEKLRILLKELDNVQEKLKENADLLKNSLACDFISKDEYNKLKDNAIENIGGFFGLGTQSTVEDLVKEVEENEEEKKDEEKTYTNELNSAKLIQDGSNLVLTVDHDCKTIKYELIFDGSKLKSETSDKKEFIIPTGNVEGKYLARVYCLNNKAEPIATTLSSIITVQF